MSRLVSSMFQAVPAVLAVTLACAAQVRASDIDPRFDPPAGSYDRPQYVVLSSNSRYGQIRYTTDGSDPTPTSTLYSDPVPVPVRTTLTLKARTYDPSLGESDVSSADYAIAFAGVVAGGGAHSLALSPDGATVWAWGDNTYGQLGDGTTTARAFPEPVPGIDDAIEIAAGKDHSLAVRADPYSNGSIVAWGRNDNGQLGDGSLQDRAQPVAVAVITGALRVAVGDAHSLALLKDGTVWAWGDNTRGQLGDGTNTQASTPIQVPGLSDVVAIAAGACHSLALTLYGQVWAWGCNDSGQLGNGTLDSSPVPVTVLNLAGVISAGGAHSVAVAGRRGMPGQCLSGAVFEWGARYGLPDEASPVSVMERTGCGEGSCTAPMCGAFGAQAGGAHSLAVKAGGLWAWGRNTHGQAGTGTDLDDENPAAALELTDVASFSAGSDHSLASTFDGTVFAWGANASGQLGDWTTEDQFRPEAISEAGFLWKAARPSLSVPSGAFEASFQVVVTSPDPAEVIHYTTDGTEPGTEDGVIASGGALFIDRSTILSVRGFRADRAPSSVVVADYRLVLPPPTLEPPPGDFETPPDVLVTLADGDATMHYTHGGAEPTEADPTVVSGTALPGVGILWVKAFKPGWESSNALGEYRIAPRAPTIQPPGGLFDAPQQVTFTAPTPGSTVHYTTNGNTPTASDPVAVPGFVLTVDRNTTVKAVATYPAPYGTLSAVTVHEFEFRAAAPAFIPPPGIYETGVLVSIVAPPGSTVRYTIDGSIPGPASPLYQAPVLVDASQTLRARALVAGWSWGDVAEGEYVVAGGVLPAPVLIPASGSFATTRPVAVSAAPGLVIHYTVDGRQPTLDDPVIASGSTVLVDRTLTLKARAWSADLASESSTRSGSYQVTGAVSLGGGSGAEFALALRSDGTVWSWGANEAGQLGNGSTDPGAAPAAVEGLVDVVAVAAGWNHGLALLSDGTVRSWGDNSLGQLGDGTFEPRHEPHAVPGLTDIVSVAAGSWFSLALKSDGTVWAWGRGDALGVGTLDNQPSPVHVSGFAGPAIVSISAGAAHGQAIDDAGRLWGWGRNFEGQAGVLPSGGFGQILAFPTVIPGVASVAAVDGGGQRSLGLVADGTSGGSVLAWGGGTAPHEAADFRDAVAVAAGWLVLREGGVLWDVERDSRVDTTAEVVAVTTAGTRAAAITSAGELWIWEQGDSPAPGPDFDLAPPAGASDADGDGLSLSDEIRLGTDPLNPDTNGDGINDGLAVSLGLSPTNPDMDGDGVLNAAEIAQGTDPFRADTDGDGVGDASDCFPLDATLVCPEGDPSDTTPPVITILRPSNAVLISTVP